MKASMKTKEQGSALIVTLVVIFLIVIAIGIAVNMTTATVRQTDSSRDFSALRSASEGALEFGYGVWVKTINSRYGPVSNFALNQNLGTPPSFGPLITYSPAGSPAGALDGTLQLTGTDQYGQPSGTTATTTNPAPTRINLDNYPGWVGYNTSYLASVRMEGKFIGNRKVQYGVKRAINYTVVPLFQATAFFEDDLELYKTATMTIGGLVHTNSKAYVSSSVSPTSGNPASLTFSGNLSFVGGYVDGLWTDTSNQQRDAPPEAWNWTGYSANSSFPPAYSNGGKDLQVDQVRRIEPLGSDAKTLLDTTDANRNNDTARELIEPPDTFVDPITQKISAPPLPSGTPYPDPQAIADRRLYNKAGIRIRVSGNSYTVTTANGTSLSTRQITALKSALSQQTITDRREGKSVDLTSLDVSKAKALITSGGPNEVGPLENSTFNNILYIDDLGSTGYDDPKGVRLVNGSILPTGGLTVASQNSVYIQGDYNTTSASTRGSAAVFADAVTILSNNWNDGNSSAKLSNRSASNTTVNTAIVAGFLPSGFTNPKTGAQYGYSGGLNNFPRFLEDWTGKTFTYTGSMIELFTSQIGTGEWDTGSIYVPPNRVWNFDSNFVDNPPPGSLDAVSLGRGALARF
jgi:hypothetical protein